MHPRFFSLAFFSFLLAFGCHHQAASPQTSPGDDPFFKEKNAQHNGDYLATYPLQHPDSCLLRLKNEVPPHLQPWACLSIWYHLPRSSPEVSFRWLQIYDENYPHDTVFAFTQMMRGEFLTQMTLHDSARTVLADARRRYLALHRPLDASDADYLIARCYNQQNNVEEALSSYFRVLELVNIHDTTFSHRHISLYFDIATVYASNADYSQQMFWLKKAQQGDSTRLTDAWKYHIAIASKMSTNYAQTERFDSSWNLAQAAVHLFRTHVKKPIPPELNYRLGFAYIKKGDCAAALPVLHTALGGPFNSPNSFMKNQIQQALGEAYFCLGRLDSAEVFTRQSLSTPDTGNLAAAHRRLGEIYARRGDYKTGYMEASQGIALFKRFFAIERAAALSKFKVRYEASRKERRIADLESQHKISQQRNLIAGLSLLLGAAVLLSLLLRQRNRHRILEQEQLILKQDKELAETLTRLKAKELEYSQVALKNTQEELISTAQLLNLKNQFIEDLEMRLKQQHLVPEEGDAPSPSSEDQALRRMKILTEDDWMRFRERFEQQIPNITPHLLSRYPSLSPAEVRLFMLLKLQFDTLEISDTLGISKESVWRSRHRLSKKLDLPKTSDLDAFVQGF